MEILLLLALQWLLLAEAAVIFNQRLVLINEKTPSIYTCPPVSMVDILSD